MVHLVDNPKMRVKKKKERITAGQIRELTKVVSQMIAITVAELPEAVLALLQSYQLPIGDDSTEKEIIQAVIEKVAEKDQAFNLDLEIIINQAIPGLSSSSQYDNFGEELKLFGSGSSGSNLLDGAKTIGTSTASGAAGGGVVGAALGAIGGIFGFANSVKQQKIEKEKASAMTLSSMLQYKTAKLGSKGAGQRTTMTIILSTLVLVGIIVTVVIISKNKKAKQWKAAKV
jgi:hypothetical protein